MSIKDNITRVTNQISDTAAKCGRDPKDIKLIAVSKTFPADRVLEAWNCGVDNFGENYVQDFLLKYDTLNHLQIKWHFIGHLQTNKIKFIYDKITLLHTLDSIKLAERLNSYLTEKNFFLDALIQINLAKEVSKSGFFEDEIEDSLSKLSSFKNLFIKGFMTIPPYFEDGEKVRPYFAKMRRLLDSFSSYNCSNIKLSELSMGMSNDFDIAIEEGATFIRVGTNIFGDRSCKI